jgi:hypothetical protein
MGPVTENLIGKGTRAETGFQDRVEQALSLTDEFEDGVFFVALALAVLPAPAPPLKSPRERYGGWVRKTLTYDRIRVSS